MAKSIKILDKEFSVSISSDEIQRRVKQIAESINRDFEGKEILFLSILNGAFMFSADLLRHITSDCILSFTKIASYEGMQPGEKSTELIGLNEDLKDRNIIVIEDIIDTGNTIHDLISRIEQFNPRVLRIATLLFKTGMYSYDHHVDYIGFDIPNDFVIGYGLDYNGYGRNFPDIYSLKTSQKNNS